MYIRGTNDLLGLTALQVCCSNSTRDMISLLVAFFHVNQADSWFPMQSSLSEGSCASMCCVSKVITRNVMHCDGPSSFSKARRVPKSWQTSLMVVRWLWHAVMNRWCYSLSLKNPGQQVCQNINSLGADHSLNEGHVSINRSSFQLIARR